jgi:3-hydroxyisobutyrate dehydrogenase-like beta-hydroxyacid dehydrogenase
MEVGLIGLGRMGTGMAKSLLRDRLLTAIARGNGESDWSVLGRVAQEDAGVDLRQ